MDKIPIFVVNGFIESGKTTFIKEVIENDDAFEYGRMVGKKEGLLVGISSGAALAAAVSLAKSEKYKGKNIVVLFPDTGDRYLSTKLYED